MKKFIELFEELDKGRAKEQIEEELNKVIDATETWGGKGSVTITIDVEKKADRAFVGCKVKSNVPQRPIAPTLMFFDSKTGLSREDPRQMKLKDVTSKKKPHAPDLSVVPEGRDNLDDWEDEDSEPEDGE